MKKCITIALSLFIIVNYSFSQNETKYGHVNPDKVCEKYGEQKALQDIKDKNIQLLVNAGYVKSDFPKKQEFEKKYNLKIVYIECNGPPVNCLLEYNKVIFSFLDKTYEKGWRKGVIKEVIGIK